MRRAIHLGFLLALLGCPAVAFAGIEVLNGPGLTYAPSPLGVPSATIGHPELKGALYTYFVRFERGMRSPPHTHPDDRIITVLSGVLYVGTGPDRLSPERVEAAPAGTVFRIPAGVPHYSWAKDGPVLVQEVGVGPTATTILPPSP